MSEAFVPNHDEINALVRLAEENLRLARLELNEGFPRGAISKAYFVFLDVARAALLREGVITKTHGGAVSKFGDVFVNTNRISKDYGRWFNRALRERQEADYEVLKSFSEDDAEEAIRHADAFLSEVRRTLTL